MTREYTKTGTAKPLSEIMTGGAEIEAVTSMLMDAIELELFMNELVTIRVFQSGEKGSLEIITPNVNGINQPIARGVPTPVKRKYVEALIQGHNISYEQEVNQFSPENFKMKEIRTTSYPFEVLDDTPTGRAWFKRVEATV